MIPIGILAAATTADSEPPLPVYEDEVLADFPILYWKLDEDYSGSTGVPVIDYSGNDRHGFYTGTHHGADYDAHPVLTPPGKAIARFNGEIIDNWYTEVGYMSSGAYYAGGSPVAGTTDFTIHFWMKPDEDLFTEPAPYYSSMWRAGSDVLWAWSRIAWIQGNRWGFWFVDGLSQMSPGDNAATLSAVASAGEFMHVALTRTSGEMSLYLNGSLVETVTNTRMIISDHMTIGWDWVGGAISNDDEEEKLLNCMPFRGLMGHLAMYNYALAPERIAQLYTLVTDI